MSKLSKSRRDARRKSMPGRALRPGANAARVHAQLRDDGGRVLAGAALRDGEWSLVLAGSVVATTESAAMALAMLHHTAAVQARAGVRTALAMTRTLEIAATAEAAEAGHTLDEHLAWLEAERQTRNQPASAPH
ncbi:hypothetical protein LDO26_04085 [Luteimonas sp. BDR2-5]|uniref:hypothetical protein n=1 Tax=Proluteimonas luteida TaxID=2878685 RepID=UPI001E32501D|nr:hypothetical protein [Luteimonas sp. BDR2-5]MCD9027394.1 hypothetical protein [Luteimonas sp. BDR2-5]